MWKWKEVQEMLWKSQKYNVKITFQKVYDLRSISHKMYANRI